MPRKLRLNKLKAHKSAKGHGIWGPGFEAKARAFSTQGAHLLKNAENHSQTIVLTNKLNDSIKQVIRHHNGLYYSTLYGIHQFRRHFRNAREEKEVNNI